MILIKIILYIVCKTFIFYYIICSEVDSMNFEIIDIIIIVNIFSSKVFNHVYKLRMVFYF